MAREVTPQEGSILRGSVRTADGTPIVGAIINVDDRVGVTSRDGTYEIHGISPGLRTIVCSADGYLAETGKILFAPGQAATLDFVLDARDPVVLEASVVGEVVDAVSLFPLEGVLLTLEPDVFDGTPPVSGTDGGFLFDEFPPGDYVLTLTLEGYRKKVVLFSAGAGDANDLGAIALVPIPANGSPSVDIEGPTTMTIAGVQAYGAAMSDPDGDLLTCTWTLSDGALCTTANITLPNVDSTGFFAFVLDGVIGDNSGAVTLNLQRIP